MNAPLAIQSAVLFGLPALLASHARFPAQFDKNADPKALFDPSGTLLDINPAALTLLGRSRKAVRGRRLFRVLARHMGSHEAEAFGLAASGMTARTSTTIARPDGHLLALELTLLPAIVDGLAIGIYVSAIDVTVRLERERATARRVQELASLFDRHADAMISVDANGRIRSVNAAYVALFGYDANDLIGRPYASIVRDDAGADAAEIFKRTMAGETVNGTIGVRHKAGHRVEATNLTIPMVVDGRVVGIYAVGHDAEHARKKNERIRELYLLAANATQSGEAQLAMALELGRQCLTCDGAYVARVDGDDLVFTHCAGTLPFREGARAALAGSSDELALRFGEPTAVEAGPFQRRGIVAPLIVEGTAYGSIGFCASQPGAAYVGEDLDYVRLVAALVSAAIDRSLQHRRLDALAFYDTLTGLPNRSALTDRITETLADARRDGLPFALHFFDLDGFKAINDEHGHACGDDVIAIIGKRLERHVGDGNLVARVGGDEFVVVQPAIAGRSDARALAERLRVAIAAPFVVDSTEHRLSASVGIALFPFDASDGPTLIARADAALYTVKGGGRDGLAFVGDPPA